MKIKSIFISLMLLSSISLTSCSINSVKENNDKKLGLVNENQIINDGNFNPLAIDNDITVGEISDFLETKKEHYPFSDEFIEKYQQTGGGYIDNAKKAGLIVDKQQHEPNQKWHYFDSWLKLSLEDGTLSLDESAKSRVYSKLICPELLLWIYEACEVDPVKVRNAMLVAMEGKASGTNVSTIAKNMRQCVSWDDIASTILNTPSVDKDKFKVSVNEGEGFIVTGLQNEYEEGREVSFSVSVVDSQKVIAEVRANETVLKQSNSKYRFNMPNKDVVIYVTLKDKEIITPPNEDFAYAKYDIIYDLGDRKTSKLIESIDELYNTFNFVSGENNVLNSISQMEYIYGGGYGGSGDNKWVASNMLKFGTTSVNGSLTIELDAEVNKIVIYGYVNAPTCKIQAGDSASSDWINSSSDNKTTTVTCSKMLVTNKENVEQNSPSSIVLEFERTSSLKIASINKKPLYITSIELYCE